MQILIIITLDNVKLKYVKSILLYHYNSYYDYETTNLQNINQIHRYTK